MKNHILKDMTQKKRADYDHILIWAETVLDLGAPLKTTVCATGLNMFMSHGQIIQM